MYSMYVLLNKEGENTEKGIKRENSNYGFPVPVKFQFPKLNMNAKPLFCTK